MYSRGQSGLEKVWMLEFLMQTASLFESTNYVSRFTN